MNVLNVGVSELTVGFVNQQNLNTVVSDASFAEGRNRLHYDQYPLNSDHLSIRALTLQPGPLDSSLQAEIYVVQLTDHPIYDTLSYVWGKEELEDYSHVIRIDETDIPISTNLHDALRDVRLHCGKEPLIIWVDALCINQASIAERNQQVQIMGIIYSRCQTVHICIGGRQSAPVTAFFFTGDDNDYEYLWDEYSKHFCFSGDSRDAAFISSVSPHYASDMFIAWMFRGLSNGTHLTEVPAFLPIVQSDHFWRRQMKHAVLDLYFQGWFWRLWVVQEAYLAPRGRAYFGSVSMPISVIITAAANYRFHMQNRCCPVFGLNKYAIDQNFAKVCDSFSSLDAPQLSIQHQHTLLELSLTFMQREASEPHDLVYALVGLAWNSSIKPDYNMDIRTLFTKVSEEHILSISNLLPLSFGRVNSIIEGIPSWAVNLRLPKTRRHPNPPLLDWFRQISNFDSCPESLQRPSFKIHDRLLHLRGYQFDNVIATSDTIEGDIDVVFTLSHYSINFRQSHARGNAENIRNDSDIVRSPNDSYPGGKTWRDAWWRTILRDHCWGTNLSLRASPRHISTLCALAEYPNDSGKWDSDKVSEYLEQLPEFKETLFSGIDRTLKELLMETIQEHMAFHTEHQKLFITDKGYLGIANQDIAKQDKIFIFPGSRVPIVLRHLDSPPGEPEPKIYRNVGDCYLHGIMDGEAARAGLGELENVVIM